MEASKNKKLVRALINLVNISNKYLALSILNFNDNIHILAFCARNFYEIHLWVRYIQKDSQCLQEWILSGAKDQNDILEFCGIMASIFPNEKFSVENAKLKSEKLYKKYNIRLPEKNIGPRSLGKKLNKENEYFIYTFFSKLLHPSFYLVNNLQEMQNLEVEKMLIMFIQLYAYDIYHSITKNITINDYSPVQFNYSLNCNI